MYEPFGPLCELNIVSVRFSRLPAASKFLILIASDRQTCIQCGS